MFRTAALLLAIASTSLADDLPQGVANTQNPADVSLTPQESLARIKVPDGFHVTLFAGEPNVRRPIAFDFDDRGRLWVVENYSHPKWKEHNATDRIVILEDADHDGQFDKRTVFWDKGRYLTGIAVGHGGVWLANTPELIFIPDRDRDDKPDAEPIIKLDGFRKSTNNVLNNFHWGPDGWLYGAIGLSDPSRVGKPGTPDSERVQITRGMWRYHPIREDFEVLAEGMVNPWGADFNEYGDLFTTNTVIAHLWHIVPGMYCQRRDAERDNPYVYQRIQSITNHLHWGGGQWQSSRAGEQHSVAGGGHAHCGAMIYLGDNWPEKYRGKFFTNNLHGNRVNCDQLVPNRSTYVGVHEEDFLLANDPWFRGMSIKYGPDGGVFVTDWHDFGECHDNDGSHYTTGRIYKIVYGKPKKRPIDLQKLSNSELAAMHLHDNEWFVRHARRILHERAAAGKDMSAASEKLRSIFTGGDEISKLRIIWTRFLINDLQPGDYHSFLRDNHEHVRRWAVSLLVDDNRSTTAGRVLQGMAEQEDSPVVRLAIASALQRIAHNPRRVIAAELLSHAEDAQDPYIPLMIWYGIEPIVAKDPATALRLASSSRIPMVRRFIARRLLEEDAAHAVHILNTATETRNETTQLDFLQGMLDSLETKGTAEEPPAWSAVYPRIAAANNPELRSVVVRLATVFGDKEAITKLRTTVLDQNVNDQLRRDALLALLKVDRGLSPETLHALVAEPSALRNDAIAALLLRNVPATTGVLLEAYSTLSTPERQTAISVLVTRRDSSVDLLRAIEDDVVDRGDVSAFALQQLRSFNDAAMQKRVNSIWANDADRLNKSDEIARYKTLLTPAYIANGSARAGRAVFERTCAKCHTLFGTGGNVGPDLTGSGRKKLGYVLSNLIDPSAIIDPAFRLTMMATTDGRVLSGFIVHQGDKYVTLRTQDAQIRLAMNDVEELQTSSKSMMPEGMLRSFTDEQVRDLVLYLASPAQVPLPDADQAAQ